MNRARSCVSHRFHNLLVEADGGAPPAHDVIQAVGGMVVQPGFIAQRIAERARNRQIGTHIGLIADCIGTASGVIGKVPFHQGVEARIGFRHRYRICQLSIGGPDVGIGPGFCQQVIFGILQRNGSAACRPVRILVLRLGYQQRLPAGHVIRQRQHVIAAGAAVLHREGIAHHIPLRNRGIRFNGLPIPRPALCQRKFSAAVKMNISRSESFPIIVISISIIIVTDIQTVGIADSLILAQKHKCILRTAVNLLDDRPASHQGNGVILFVPQIPAQLVFRIRCHQEAKPIQRGLNGSPVHGTGLRVSLPESQQQIAIAAPAEGDGDGGFARGIRVSPCKSVVWRTCSGIPQAGAAGGRAVNACDKLGRMRCAEGCPADSDRQLVLRVRRKQRRQLVSRKPKAIWQFILDIGQPLIGQNAGVRGGDPPEIVRITEITKNIVAD